MKNIGQWRTKTSKSSVAHRIWMFFLTAGESGMTGAELIIERKRFYALHHFCKCGILYAMHQNVIEDDKMDCKTKIKELRESTGMNRKEFCDFFQIPYRTVTDWERDNRHAPDYVLRLLEYYIRMEGQNNKHNDKCNSE